MEEQLAVVIAALTQHRSGLATGNVIGSSISNILGAFSLGLLFHPGPMVFDRSSKIYTALLLLLTTVFVALAYFKQIGRIVGALLIALFALYIISIALAIYRGVVDAPEGSDSDESDSGTSDDDSDEESITRRSVPAGTETSPLLANNTVTPNATKTQRPRGLTYHITQLVLGFATLSISGYLLAHAASSIADALGISGTVLGMTILSLATTLPEKFVAVLGGSRGHAGIIVANTAGSNIFLLTLCLGVVLVNGGLDSPVSSVTVFELTVTWTSAALFFLVVILGVGRWAGAVMLASYVAFLVLEITVYRR